MRQGEEISIPTFHTMALPVDYRVQTAFLSMLYTVVVKKGPRHFGTWEGTVRHLGQDSSALRSELSLGHFGISADLSGQLRTHQTSAEVSRVRSVRNSCRCSFSVFHSMYFTTYIAFYWHIFHTYGRLVRSVWLVRYNVSTDPSIYV